MTKTGKRSWCHSFEIGRTFGGNWEKPNSNECKQKEAILANRTEKSRSDGFRCILNKARTNIFSLYFCFSSCWVHFKFRLFPCGAPITTIIPVKGIHILLRDMTDSLRVWLFSNRHYHLCKSVSLILWLYRFLSGLRQEVLHAYLLKSIPQD